MADYLNTPQLYNWALDWISSNVLIATNAEQLATVAAILVCFFFFVRPINRFFVGMTERFSVRAVHQILVPLALIRGVPWLLLLLAFWFATLVFAERQLGTTILRLAESLTLAWVIIKLSSRLVRSDRLARALAVLAFVVAALNIAGLLGTVTGLLDSMAAYVGSLRISVLLLVKAAATLALFLWLASTFARVLETRLKRLSELTPAMQVLTLKLVRFALITLAVVLALGSVGIDLTAVAVFSGAVGVGIGLGLQKVVNQSGPRHNPFGRPLHQAWRRDRDGGQVWLDNEPQRTLCLARDPRWQGTPDPKRRSNHRTGDELVVLERFDPSKYKCRRLIRFRRAPRNASRGRGGGCG
jgi:small-conductance mechanosensitive channel